MGKLSKVLGYWSWIYIFLGVFFVASSFIRPTGITIGIGVVSLGGWINFIKYCFSIGREIKRIGKQRNPK